MNPKLMYVGVMLQNNRILQSRSVMLSVC